MMTDTQFVTTPSSYHPSAETSINGDERLMKCDITFSYCLLSYPFMTAFKRAFEQQSQKLPEKSKFATTKKMHYIVVLP